MYILVYIILTSACAYGCAHAPKYCAVSRVTARAYSSARYDSRDRHLGARSGFVVVLSTCVEIAMFCRRRRVFSRNTLPTSDSMSAVSNSGSYCLCLVSERFDKLTGIK